MIDPNTHITVRIDPISLLNDDEGDAIWAAIERLPIPPDRIGEVRNRSDDLIDRVRHAGLSAGIRPAPANLRGTPSEIIAAANDVARGLDQIERGLGTLERARQSTSESATGRSEALRQMHEDILRSITATIAYALPTAIIRDVDLVASSPSYGPLGFSNPWRGAFSRAAGQVDKIANCAAPEQLRAPKPRDEWFGRLVQVLAAIYEEATGERAKAYARGQAVNSSWRPPFCVFVTELWPLWGSVTTAPSDSKIRDALAKTTKLLSRSQA